MVKKKMSRVKLIQKSRNGYLDEVQNPKGKKASVYIYQGMKPGFSARYVKSGRDVSGSGRSAEALARKLARAGHKKVIFRD